MFAPEDILIMLNLLIGYGFLKEEGETRPPVDLTRKGFRALAGELEPGDAESIASLSEDMKRIGQARKPQVSIPEPDRTLSGWLYNHLARLEVEERKHLNRLKAEYDGSDRPDDDSLYDEHWKQLSKQLRAERGCCEVCGSEAEETHHRHYRTFGNERPEDVVVLCHRCHCYIHPDSPMTRDAFEEVKASEKDQIELFSIPQTDSIVTTILYCAKKTDGQVGRRGLMKILRGEKSRKLTKYEFDHIDEYAILSG